MVTLQCVDEVGGRKIAVGGWRLARWCRLGVCTKLGLIKAEETEVEQVEVGLMLKAREG